MMVGGMGDGRATFFTPKGFAKYSPAPTPDVTYHLTALYNSCLSHNTYLLVTSIYLQHQLIHKSKRTIPCARKCDVWEAYLDITNAAGVVMSNGMSDSRIYMGLIS